MHGASLVVGVHGALPSRVCGFSGASGRAA